MKNDSFTCIFHKSQYLIYFTFSIENNIKSWPNKIKPTPKNVWKTMSEMQEKKKPEKY